MFDVLRREIEGLGVPVDGPLLVELLALRDRFEARVSAAVGEYDASELWDVEGFTSMSSWLRSRAAMAPGDAKRAAVTAARIRRCPTVQAAWAEGSLSSGQVAVVVANVTERLVGVFEAQEAEVVPLLAELDLRDTTTVMRDWAVRAEASLGDPPEPADPTGTAHLSR